MTRKDFLALTITRLKAQTDSGLYPSCYLRAPNGYCCAVGVHTPEYNGNGNFDFWARAISNEHGVSAYFVKSIAAAHDDYVCANPRVRPEEYNWDTAFETIDCGAAW